MHWTKEALVHCPKKLAGNPPNVAWMAEQLGDGLLVDVGANVGALCVATLLECPKARGVAFEPQTRVADILEDLVKVNGVDVKLHRMAVGADPGEATLLIPADPSMSGWATIAPRPEYEGGTKETVEVTTLNTWWEEAGQPDVRVVKVDTQGAEVDVLIGGAALFATVPFLFIELHGPTLAEHGRTMDEMLQCLSRLGYDWDQDRVNLRCWKKGQG